MSVRYNVRIMRKKGWIFVSILGVCVIALLVWWVYALQQPGKYDALATCLKERGAVFYGAFWCGHCKNQKTMFGKSASLLPYVECSSTDGQQQLQACKDKNIGTYPTWVFADGTRESGEISLKDLSEKTGCTLP